MLVHVADDRDGYVHADSTSFEVIARVDTPQEAGYIAHGGILQYVLRRRAAQMKR